MKINPFQISTNVFVTSFWPRWESFVNSLIDYGVSIREAAGLPRKDYIDYDIVISAVRKINPDAQALEFPVQASSNDRYGIVPALLKLSVYDPSPGALSLPVVFHGTPGDGGNEYVSTTGPAATDVLTESAEQNIQRYADWAKEIPGNPENPRGPKAYAASGYGPFGLIFSGWGSVDQKGSRSTRCGEWAGGVYEARISSMGNLAGVMKGMMDDQLRRDLAAKSGARIGTKIKLGGAEDVDIQRATRANYAVFNRIISSGLVGAGSGTVGEEEESKKDESGCEHFLTEGNLDAYKKCENDYWGATAGDCHTFKTRAESNDPVVDKPWCRSKGGTGDEPCLELAHSCVSTVVCQVFNYIFAEGAFSKECGKYGEPVGDVIWYASGFEVAAGLLGPLSEAIKCIGADTGSCWPNIESVAGKYKNVIDSIVQSITETWDAQREALGLPPSNPCIDYPFLSIAAMLGRGELPDTASPQLRNKLLTAMKGKGYKIESYAQTCPQGPPCDCKPGSFSIEQAIVELSLWTDPNGFGLNTESAKMFFLNQNNWVQAGSWGVSSSVQLVDPAITSSLRPMTMSKLQFAGQLSGAGTAPPIPKMLPKGSKTIRLYPIGSAQWAGDTADRGAFNVHIIQSGGPGVCKSTEATNDSKVCAQVAQHLFEDRLQALYRVLPLVVGAMSAHNAEYAMLWKQAHGVIDLGPTDKKKNPLTEGRIQNDGAGDAGTSWLKCLLTLGIVSAAGYGAYKYWPKK